MKKIILFLVLILLPNLGFAKTYDASLKHPDFVISRQEWGADESLRWSRSHPRRSGGRYRMSQEEKDFRAKYAEELKKAKVVTKDPKTSESLHWPVSYSREVKAFAIHHSATEIPIGREVDALKAIYYWHSMVRGWGDIGYNYVIDPQGNIYEGRAGGPFAVGGHTNLYNTGSVGIMLMGNYNDTIPTSPSLVALKKLLVSLSDMYKVDLEQIISFRDKENVLPILAHREMSNTACPGDNFHHFLAFWRNNQDFSSDLVASSSLASLSGKDFYQIPAGSSLSMDFLGIPDPVRTVTISQRETDIREFRSDFKIPSEESLTIFSYSQVGKRGDQKVLEVRDDYYGLGIVKKPPIMIVMNPGEKKRIMVGIENGFMKDFRYNDFFEISNRFSVFDSFLASGGELDWFSNRLIPMGRSRDVILEIVAPRKEGMYESRLVYDLGDGNILGGEPISLRLKVGEGMASRNIDTFKIALDKVERNIKLDKGLSRVDIKIPVEPNISKADFEKYVKSPAMAILGKDIPKGIKTFINHDGNDVYLLLIVSANVDSGVYEFFSIMDSEEGIFESKSIKVKLNIEKPGPFEGVTEPKVRILLRDLSGVDYKLEERKNDTVVLGYSRNHTWDSLGQYPDNVYRGKIMKIENHYVNVIDLEKYLLGLAEVSNDDEFEKMKAIAVAARSYMYHYTESQNRKFGRGISLPSGELLDVDGSDDPREFQRYLGKGLESRLPMWIKAVNDTKGQMLVFKDKVIKPPYFNTSNGETLSVDKVWGWSLTEYPYLGSKEDPWCEGFSLNGHGVGMSGCGAQGQAREGKDYKEILQYYYPEVDVVKVY